MGDETEAVGLHLIELRYLDWVRLGQETPLLLMHLLLLLSGTQLVVDWDGRRKTMLLRWSCYSQQGINDSSDSSVAPGGFRVRLL